MSRSKKTLAERSKAVGAIERLWDRARDQAAGDIRELAAELRRVNRALESGLLWKWAASLVAGAGDLAKMNASPKLGKDELEEIASQLEDAAPKVESEDELSMLATGLECPRLAAWAVILEDDLPILFGALGQIVGHLAEAVGEFEPIDLDDEDYMADFNESIKDGTREEQAEISLGAAEETWGEAAKAWAEALKTLEGGER